MQKAVLLTRFSCKWQNNNFTHDQTYTDTDFTTRLNLGNIDTLKYESHFPDKPTIYN